MRWAERCSTELRDQNCKSFHAPRRRLQETADYVTYTGRLDQVFSDKHRLYARGSYYDRDSFYNDYFDTGLNRLVGVASGGGWRSGEVLLTSDDSASRALAATDGAAPTKEVFSHGGRL